MIITFTDTEMQQIEYLALIRHHSAGVAVPPKFSKLDALGIDRLGAMGEAALSKHFNWAVSTMLFTNRDDGRDFKTDLGSLQVKTREDPRAGLYIQSTRKFRADYGVLCRKVDDNAIEIAGWFYKETWEKFSEAKEFGGSVKFVLSRDYMNHNIDDLLD
jgi:hypothetical protein